MPLEISDFVPVMNRNECYSRYEIGDYTYGHPVVLFPEDGRLKIGKFCSIADGATFLLGGYHHIDWGTTYPFGDFSSHLTLPAPGIRVRKGDITIGNDVYLGQECFILAGVTVGDGAVVGARAVVTKDVVPYSVVVGNPAQHIKYRFDEAIIGAMLKIAWWDWPAAQIEEALPLLLTGNIQEFVDKYKRD